MSRIARARRDTGQRDEIRLREQDRRVIQLAGDAQSRARGAVAFAKRPTGSGTTFSGAGSTSPLVAVSAEVNAGRRYKISASATCYVVGDTASTVECRLSYVLGAEATVSHPVLRYWPVNPPGASYWQTGSDFGIYDATADGVLSVLFWAGGTQARSYGVIGNATAEAQILVEDIGPAPSVAAD